MAGFRSCAKPGALPGSAQFGSALRMAQKSRCRAERSICVQREEGKKAFGGRSRSRVAIDVVARFYTMFAYIPLLSSPF